MLKKILFSLFSSGLMLSSTLTYAYGQDNWRDFHAYIGITGGVSILEGDYRAHDDTIFGENHRVHAGSTDGLVGGVIGIQTIFSDIFFAIQANALYNSTDRLVRSGTTPLGVVGHSVNLKNNFQYGIDARIGITFCGGATPYILGGVEGAKWTMELRNDTLTPFRGILPGTTNISETLWGPKVGAGVTFPISCNISGNIEYSYTWFGRISRDLLDPLTAVNWNHRHEIHQNAFTFGLNYLF